ncbi:hypothetical protein BU24DRAFT_377942 [Aaosphaeria arxii CBS 175.79]|uniref:Alpha/beta-hydrolase n=1 Tax=Aaosphaeria arxii CBS 175.79 TaxID=1450172 RepID=A0A6A5XE10_9PLEO|nr:uncharacterized protein BU24DRAFT_377942 [Aaosphaeria arxii CBS 175.79]KAF2011101.1 hypothetical protein BU24DRAFT_377942 [Aaosphaeria arxii CBS 175.79]
MADSTTQSATPRTGRQTALAEIQFTSLTDTDLTSSEGDETPDEKEFQLDSVQSAIGVSIGEQQRYLISPKTPAAEKAAALDEIDGGAFFGSWSQSQEAVNEQDVTPQANAVHVKGTAENASLEEPVLTKHDSPIQIPSPERTRPRVQIAEEPDHRGILRDSFSGGSRRRAMSGGSTSETLKKYLTFNLPSMSKSPYFFNFSLSSFSGSSKEGSRSHSPAVLQRKRVASLPLKNPYGSIPQRDGTSSSKEVDPKHRLMHPATAPLPHHQTGSKPPLSTGRSHETVPPVGRPAPQLRRSNSEGSLAVYRSLSLVSSLGDDSRFENVTNHANSRLRAIKDSWQDSTFKLPSLPTLPNFGLGSKEDVSRVKSLPREPNDSRASFSNASRASFFSGSSNRAKDSSTNLPGTASGPAATHPLFTKATQELTGDLVILGGYRGSILRSAQAPNRQLWVPIKVGLNLRKVDLEVGLNPEDEETEEERIIPAGMLTHIGPVDIARRLFKRLQASENAQNGSLRVHNYGYDWRLSPHLLSRRMIKYLESLPCNQPGVPPEKRGATVIAHSLGGLITRHAVNQRPDLFAGVIYAGVPQDCINILGPLRCGDAVLLSSRVLTAQVNFTIRTSYALLPLDGKGFIDKKTKEDYIVDFFDINTWKELRLSPCIAPALPALQQGHNLQPLTSVSGLFNAMSSALPTKRRSIALKEAQDAFTNATNIAAEGTAQVSGVTPHITTALPSTSNSLDTPTSPTSAATAVTIPYDKAVEYLTRTLAEVKQFKLELAHRPEHTEANRYPPIALMYGKSIPTVYGAKVDGIEGAKRTDAYDDLAFASGDGVVLARASQVPKGYSVVRGGVVSSDRGHITLLGDLEAVGRCLSAVVGARQKGVGLGQKRETVPDDGTCGAKANKAAFGLGMDALDECPTQPPTDT